MLQDQRSPVSRPNNIISSNIIQAQTPKRYPNNTLIEDLSKCHEHLRTVLWPRASRAKRALLELLQATCLPAFLRASRRGQKGQKASVSCDDLDASKQISSIIISQHEFSLPQQQQQQQQQVGKPAPVPLRRRGRRRRRHRGDKCKFQMPDTVRDLNSNVSIKQISLNLTRSTESRSNLLTQHDYNQALIILTSDVRFKLHRILYRRVQTIWTLLTSIFCILMPVLLFTNFAATIVILSSLFVWLLLQITGALLCRNFRNKLDQMLEKAVAQANSYFMDHNLMLGVINAGGLLKKSRLCIPMFYFDTTQCREQIESIINIDCESQKQKPNGVSKENGSHEIANLGACPLVLDYSKFGLPNKEPAIGQSFAFAQSLARKILLRYSQRWISYFDKRKLMFNDDKMDEPRHLSTGKCLCQFIEEHFKSVDRHSGGGGGGGGCDVVDDNDNDDQEEDEFNDIDCDNDDDDDDDDDGDSPDDNDECCSIDELTDIVDGSKHANKINSFENCVRIDINNLLADTKNYSLLKDLIEMRKNELSALGQLPALANNNQRPARPIVVNFNRSMNVS